jgi:hypothetical protein
MVEYHASSPSDVVSRLLYGFDISTVFHSWFPSRRDTAGPIPSCNEIVEVLISESRLEIESAVSFAVRIDASTISKPVPEALNPI